MLLGCIADDFTGTTGLANMPVRGGMRTVQVIGVPNEVLEDIDAEATVVALRSRTIAPAGAISQSLVALALPANFAKLGMLRHASGARSTAEWPCYRAVAPRATNAQVSHWRQSRPAFKIDPHRLGRGEDLARAALAWTAQHTGPILIYATAQPKKVKAEQSTLGAAHAGN